MFKRSYHEREVEVLFSVYACSENLEVTYFSEDYIDSISNQNVNMNSCIYLKLCRNI